MPAQGQPFTVRITGVQNAANLSFTCSGAATSPDVVAVQGQSGAYDVTFSGDEVTCPGPVRIVEKVGGSEVTRYEGAVTGC